MPCSARASSRVRSSRYSGHADTAPVSGAPAYGARSGTPARAWASRRRGEHRDVARQRAHVRLLPELRRIDARAQPALERHEQPRGGQGVEAELRESRARIELGGIHLQFLAHPVEHEARDRPLGGRYRARLGRAPPPHHLERVAEQRRAAGAPLDLAAGRLGNRVLPDEDDFVRHHAHRARDFGAHRLEERGVDIRFVMPGYF